MSNNTFEQTSSASICVKCKTQTLMELREAKAVKQWKSFKSSGDILPAARVLLHYHNKLDHMGFNKLKELARACCNQKSKATPSGGNSTDGKG